MHPQRAAALAFLALSLGYTVLAARIEDAVRSPVAVLGPRGFPLIVGAAGILVSLLLLRAAARAIEPAAVAVDAARPTPLPATAASPASPARGAGLFAGDWGRTLALCGLMLAYALALPVVGFLLSTAGFLAASFRLLGERRKGALIVVPIAIAALLFALLSGALDAHLPEPLLDAVLTRRR
jgi:hypothetical protein